jgi:hypothetical protein
VGSTGSSRSAGNCRSPKAVTTVGAPSVLARSIRDAELTEQIRQVHEENYSVCGVRKVRAQLRRDSTHVARCSRSA